MYTLWTSAVAELGQRPKHHTPRFTKHRPLYFIAAAQHACMADIRPGRNFWRRMIRTMTSEEYHLRVNKLCDGRCHGDNTSGWSAHPAAWRRRFVHSRLLPHSSGFVLGSFQPGSDQLPVFGSDFRWRNAATVVQEQLNDRTYMNNCSKNN